eukprot:13539196-Alexandrium_andersonii.AAC.1
MVAHNARSADAKRAAIVSHLERGRHWDAYAAAEWAAVLPGARAVASIVGADGPRQPGGVAVVLPAGWECEQEAVPVAGYAVA